jgi:hypothetical protein
MEFNPFERPLRNLLSGMLLLPLVTAGLLLMPPADRDYLVSIAFALPFAGPIILLFLSTYSYPLWLVLPLLGRVSGRGLLNDAIVEADAAVRIPLLFAEGFFRLYRRSRSLARGEGEEARKILSYLVALTLFASLGLRALPQALALISVLSLLCWLASGLIRETEPLEEIRKPSFRKRRS